MEKDREVSVLWACCVLCLEFVSVAGTSAKNHFEQNTPRFRAGKCCGILYIKKKLLSVQVKDMKTAAFIRAVNDCLGLIAAGPFLHLESGQAGRVS